MKLLYVFLNTLVLGILLSSPVLAVEQVRNGIPIGFLQTVSNPVASTTALSSAAGAGGWGLSYSQTGLAYSFVPTLSKQVSKIKVFASAVGGTLGANDLVADLWSDNAGVGPNTGSASIESRNTVTATPTGAAWVEFTGFTATSTLTAGTQYWIVLRNANVTPTVNFPTYRYTGGTSPVSVIGTGAGMGFIKWHTTDGGATWITAATTITGWRIEFSDGTFMGEPISNVTTTTGDYVYAAREVGVMLTTPPNATINIIGVAFSVARVGSTQGSLRFRLYTGNSATPTLLATTPLIPRLNLASTSTWTVAYFATPQTVTGGTVLRAVWGNSSGGGDTSNAYLSTTYTIDNTAASKALYSLGGVGFQKTLSTDGITFAETDTSLFPFALILDTNGEFTATGASASGVIGG